MYLYYHHLLLYLGVNCTSHQEAFSGHIQDDSLTVGGEVKRKGEVLLQHLKRRCRPANTSCRIESFGRICKSFDERRKRWVGEMGFGGLLKFGGDMNLPRQLSYWLMTRIDPFNCTLTTQDGRVYRLSQNQVHWVLGIPNGGLPVPTYQTMDNDAWQKVNRIMERYGKTWSSKCSRSGREYTFEGIQVNVDLIARVEGEWEEYQAEEFKTVFLLLCLEMLLCPNQSSRLATDLVPSLTCASRAADYDWCSLVLQKLMESVAMFARRFYSVGFASGCAGCLIFIVVLYLDRLNRHPVNWGYFPRVEVWNMEEIRLAISEDRLPNGGDFGKLGTLDVAYGETHPTEARDTNGPGGTTERSCCVSVCFRSKVARMRKSKVKKVKGKSTADISDNGENKAIIFPGNNNMGPKTNFDLIRFRMDVMKRCLSDDALNTLLRITSWVARQNEARQSAGPCFWSSLLGEFVLFPGTIGADPMSRGCVDCFVGSPCCAYMASVSEVDGASSFSSVCVFVKYGNVQDISVVYSNSLTSSTTIYKVNKRVANVEHLFQAFHNVLNGFSVDNIRNVIITKDFNCVTSCSSPTTSCSSQTT